MDKKTKVICTIGPASNGRKAIKGMLSAGMNCARINLAHGDFPDYVKMIGSIRASGDVPIMMDVKGPEIRIFTERSLELKQGERFEVGFSDKHPNHFNHDFSDQVREGMRILMNDGLIETKIVEKKRDSIVLRNQKGAVLNSGKGVNIPGAKLKISSLTDRDREAIKFSMDHGLDYIALSFTQTSKDVKQLRKMLEDTGMGIIAKIENLSGLRNINKIINSSDGIMIARGDLGVEIPSERLPMVQKELIAKCNVKGKIAIVATEMLKSMVSNWRPTRAETSDVANAVLDGADCVMLSEETAVGKYPVEAVSRMAKIIREVEPHVETNVIYGDIKSIPKSISSAVYEISCFMPVDKIVVMTRSGYTAKLISRFRMNKPILAVTRSEKVRRKLELCYGVNPVVHDCFFKHKRVPRTVKLLLDKGHLRGKDTILFTAGVYSKSSTTNMLEIHKVREVAQYCPEK